MKELLGWISAFCFTFSGVPELIRAVDTGIVGTSWGTLILWFTGEICIILYTWELKKIPLLANYFFNLIIVGFLLIIKALSV